MASTVFVDNVSKRFRLRPGGGTGSLRESLTRLVSGRRTDTTTLWALRNVSFRIEPGTTFGIIGHNGAGKSTLLRLLCGLSRPTSGRIVTSGTISGILELGGGFNLDLTGRQNLLTVGILHGCTPAEVRAREAQIIAFAELERFIDQPVRTYSSGMYLRLAFASAMAFDPAVLVLDEVLAVGDERFQQKCLQRLDELKRRGTTLIVTSHNPDQIQSLCDEVLVLEEGTVAMQGPPQHALTAYHDLLRQRTDARAQILAGTAPIATPPTDQRLGSRQGTMEARIESLSFHDADGRPAEQIASGTALTVTIRYRAGSTIHDMALLLGIYTEASVKCFETSIDSMASTFGTLGSDGTIRCTFPALPLLPGRHYVSLGLYPTDWSFIYDYHWQMHSFRIGPISTLKPQDTGVLALTPRWSSEK